MYELGMDSNLLINDKLQDTTYELTVISRL